MEMEPTVGMDGGMHGSGMHDGGMHGDASMNGTMHGGHGGGMDGGHGMDGSMHGSHGNGTMDHAMNMHHMMMMMYFHFSKNIPNLLFESWTIDAVGELIGAIVFTLVLAVLYEGLKTLREYLMCVALQKTKKKEKEEKMKLPDKSSDNDDKCDCNDVSSEQNKRWHGLKHHTIAMSMHIVQSLLHVLQVGMAYILMLIAMTFNAWLFLAVVFGSGIGYFIFSRVRHLSSPFRESNDHCH